MSNRRAEMRRAERVRPKIQVVAGVMRDRLPYSRQEAAAAADRQLPPVPNSRILLALYKPDEGLRILAETVYQNNPAMLDDIRSRLARMKTYGTEPTVVVARRDPITEQQETRT